MRTSDWDWDLGSLDALMQAGILIVPDPCDNVSQCPFEGMMEKRRR